MKLILVAISAVALLAACSEKQVPKPAEHVVSGDRVVARWKTCPKPDDERENPPQLQCTLWSGSTFVVVALDNHACGGSQIANPKYVLAGDDLQLRWTWTWKSSNEITKCTCAHTVQFELSNQEPKNYKIQLIRE